MLSTWDIPQVLTYKQTGSKSREKYIMLTENISELKWLYKYQNIIMQKIMRQRGTFHNDKPVNTSGRHNN